MPSWSAMSFWLTLGIWGKAEEGKGEDGRKEEREGESVQKSVQEICTLLH